MNHTDKPKKSAGSKGLTVLISLFLMFYILFLLVIVLCVVFIVRGETDRTHKPSIFGVTPLLMDSADYLPERDGSVALVALTDLSKMENGDEVAFVSGNIIRVGTIVGLKQTPAPYFEISAGEEIYEVPFDPEYVPGTVSYYIPKLGDFANFIDTTWGILLCVGVPGVILIMMIIAEVYYDLLKRKRKVPVPEVVVEQPAEEKKGMPWWLIASTAATVLAVGAAVTYGTREHGKAPKKQETPIRRTVIRIRFFKF